ncbi:DUF1801 domain-containing protein [Catalinimonas sp. 4WD22]|uniref:DUF1801 domain-containing protein n=1 Tax=Catalinimonas locisalis TaxID=3133978 RepID=UPI00310114AE
MATLKTQPNSSSVEAFLNGIEDQKKKADSLALLKLFEEWTHHSPKMWGDSIVGYGTYHYRYDSGREGDWFLTGFSPRKQNLSLYIMPGFERYDNLMEKLGKYKTGKSCLYIKKLSEIDLNVLKELISQSIQYLKEKYPS